ncbi:RAB18A, member ras oncogene family [Paraphysoderma sedebokerense]|nr:RAB18A, member ras oncogene family [Paraphysoderma sedebokerense]
MTKIEATIKLLLIGDSGSGKSSLLLRYLDDTFQSEDEISATIGVDFRVKVIDVDDKKYKLTLWDTAGQERFRTLTSSYYRGAHGLMLVYDITNRESFQHLESWMKEVDIYVGGRDVKKVLIGNKIDMNHERQIKSEEGLSFATAHNMTFFECSAKSDDNVSDAFAFTVDQIINSSILSKRASNSSSIELSGDENQVADSRGCYC